MFDLTPSTDRAAALVSGISDDQLKAPSPCDDMPVGLLLAHLHGLSIAFRDAARKIDGPTTNTAPDPAKLSLVDDWRDAVPTALAELARAWRDPASWQGMTMAGGQSMPAEVAGTVAVDEVVLHSWDLAVAIGQPYLPDPDALNVVEQFCAGIGDDPAERQGLFGRRITIADDAPQLDRVLALAGRDSQWSR